MLKQWIEYFIIKKSGLLDPKYYLLNNPDVRQADIDPLMHFIKNGWKEGKNPSDRFTTSFYLSNNPDVAKSRINPLIHYLRYGKQEGRHPNPLSDSSVSISDNADVSKSGYKEQLPKPRVELAEIKINMPWKNISLFHRIRLLIAPPNSLRIRILKKVIKFISIPFDRMIRLFSKNPDSTKDPTMFDVEWYLATNPDVTQAKVDPYQHYLQHGISEGRFGIPPKIETRAGFIEFDSSRDTVLVVSHEASRTGAPILSLNIAQNLRNKYNVVSLLLGKGVIAEYFLGASTFVVGPFQGKYCNKVLSTFVIDQVVKNYKIKFAIVNSIESRVILPALARRFIPTVSLIHEFSAYTRPRSAFLDAILWSNEVVFSASVTRENCIADYPELEDHHFHTIPQGHCALPNAKNDTISRPQRDAKILKRIRPENSPADTVVVLSIGTIQYRKGVDLFIDCAARVLQSRFGKNFRFVWIGNGYDPEVDMEYSVYLADQIRRAGLHDHVIFLEATSSIEVAYKAADVLLISSRLDPLPNVAIDAMMNELPLVCFNETTGIADILIANGLGDECIVPYLDTARMTANVIAFAQSKPFRQKVGKELRKIALREFNMVNYISRLEKIGLASCDLISQEQIDIAEIKESGLARPDFYRSPHIQLPPDELIQYYVRTWANAISRRKLFPGFHPGIYHEQQGFGSKDDPLANYLRAGKPTGLWQNEVITSEIKAQSLPSKVRIALHLHVYYLELLPEILIRLNKNRVRPDLLISVPTESIREETQNLVSQNYSGKVIEIKVVPNSGRDIGPFLTAFGTVIEDHYDFVGHFHTKKSEHTRFKNRVENWYSFLLENLLGGKSNMADIILGQLANDPSIGVVFPDDPNVIGWGLNKPYAEALGQRLGLDTLPERIWFPVGNMFWARVEALLPFINLGLDWQDYPPEPLPYDGSILHAIERLLPLVVSGRGFRSLLTNVPGITR